MVEWRFRQNSCAPPEHALPMVISSDSCPACSLCLRGSVKGCGYVCGHSLGEDEKLTWKIRKTLPKYSFILLLWSKKQLKSFHRIGQKTLWWGFGSFYLPAKLLTQNVKASEQTFFWHTSPAKIWKCHGGASWELYCCASYWGCWCFPHCLVRAPVPTGAWPSSQHLGKEVVRDRGHPDLSCEPSHTVFPWQCSPSTGSSQSGRILQWQKRFHNWFHCVGHMIFSGMAKEVQTLKILSSLNDVRSSKLAAPCESFHAEVTEVSKHPALPLEPIQAPTSHPLIPTGNQLCTDGHGRQTQTSPRL